MHNEELYNLYSSPYISRVIKPGRVRCVGRVTHMGDMTNGYKILVGNPEIKRPLSEN
jgi:hypothetical protein